MKNRKRFFSIPAVLLCLWMLFAFPVQAGADDSIIAEKVEWSQLQPGDRFYIVNRAADRAISLNTSKTRLSQATVTTGQTETRQVLTDAEEGAALFEMIDAGDGSVYLKSDLGYMTSSEDGRSLFYTGTPEAYSRWQAEEGMILTNTDLRIESGDDKPPMNVYIEYYPRGMYFSSIGLYEKSGYSYLAVDFYKSGNSRPEEPLLKEDLYFLPVFETSDLHGVLADMSGEEPIYQLAYISDKVKDVRGYEPNTRKELAVLLDGGDIYQGTSVSGVTNGHALSAAFDLMGYDAVTVGNHEFDWGLDTALDPDGTMPDYSLRRFVGENKIPVLAANLYLNGEKLPNVQDYLILDKTARNAAGAEMPVKVGVIAIADTYDESILYEKFTGAGYTISEDYEAVNALAAELEDSGQCDATILLVHGQGAKAADSLGEDTVIDLVLGGHKHNYENWKTDWGLNYLAPSGKAGSLCCCEMTFREENAKPVFSGISDAHNLFIRQSYKNIKDAEQMTEELDPELVALTDAVYAAAREILGAEIGYITERAWKMDWFPESGEHSSALGNWVCSIFARMAGAEIGMLNSGGIRASFAIPEGQDTRVITLEDIYQMLPFDNDICLYEITYEELKKVLEYSLTRGGKIMISEASGIICYYTNQTVQAILTDDGDVIYEHEYWKEGWREKKVRVAMPVFLSTTKRQDRDTGMVNPFWEWKDTFRKLPYHESQIEGTLRVLTAEAAENDGYLFIDTKPHYISSDYPGYTWETRMTTQ